MDGNLSYSACSNRGVMVLLQGYVQVYFKPLHERPDGVAPAIPNNFPYSNMRNLIMICFCSSNGSLERIFTH